MGNSAMRIICTSLCSTKQKTLNCKINVSFFKEEKLIFAVK